MDYLWSPESGMDEVPGPKWVPSAWHTNVWALSMTGQQLKGEVTGAGVRELPEEAEGFEQVRVPTLDSCRASAPTPC